MAVSPPDTMPQLPWRADPLEVLVNDDYNAGFRDGEKKGRAMLGDRLAAQQRTPKTLGYIVSGEMGPMLLSRQTGVLAFGDVATVCPNRDEAKQAISRTLTYAQAHGYDWDSRYQIYRVTGAGPKVDGRRRKKVGEAPR
jgi:hypothetical protein